MEGVLKIHPDDLSKKHIGMVCVIRFTIAFRGEVGHSFGRGSEYSEVHAYYLLLGRICDVTDEEILFCNCHYGRHAHDMTWGLGPHYSHSDNVFIVDRNTVNKRMKVYLNKTEGSNAVAQHLRRSNKSEYWNQERRLLEFVKLQ